MGIPLMLWPANSLHSNQIDVWFCIKDWAEMHYDIQTVGQRELASSCGRTALLSFVLNLNGLAAEEGT